MIIGYLRCVNANWFTKWGFVSLFGGLFGQALIVRLYDPVVGFAVVLHSVLGTAWAIGAFMLTFTAVGLDTYRAYRRTRRAIEWGGIGYVRDNVHASGYCGEVGVDLAIEEARKKGVGS